jgi:hypothetical protein
MIDSYWDVLLLDGGDLGVELAGDRSENIGPIVM